MKLRSSSASCPNCWRSSFLMSAGLLTFESNEKSVTSSPMSLRTPFDEARVRRATPTIYHNPGLVGFAEVVYRDDLVLSNAGGCLIRSPGLSKIVSDQTDTLCLLAFNVQKDSGSWFNFGVPDCGIFHLVQNDGRKLCCRRSARKTIEFQTLNV